MVTTLSRVYTDTIGEWAGIVFLLMALAVLGSTLWAYVPAFSRAYANFLSVAGVFDWNDMKSRERWFKVFTVAIPMVAGASYLFFANPILMVQIGGIMTGIFLVAVVVAVWHLRREVDRRLHGGKAFFVVFTASSVTFGILGIYTLLQVFGVGV